jgi:aminopeptidase
VRSTTLAAPLLHALQSEILRRGLAGRVLRVFGAFRCSRERFFTAAAGRRTWTPFAPPWAGGDTPPAPGPGPRGGKKGGALPPPPNRGRGGRGATCSCSPGARTPPRSRAWTGEPASPAAGGRAAAPVFREAALTRRFCSTLAHPHPQAPSTAGLSDDFAGSAPRPLVPLTLRRRRRLEGASNTSKQAHRGFRAPARAAHQARGTRIYLVVAGADPGQFGTAPTPRAKTCPAARSSTGPVDTSAEGHVRFTIRLGPGGIDVDGIESRPRRRSWLQRPRPARAGSTCRRTLATDAWREPPRGKIGSGTTRHRPARRRDPVRRRKIGGSVHLPPFGRSLSREPGGTNVSAVHWDHDLRTAAGGRLSADGEVIRRGRPVHLNPPPAQGPRQDRGGVSS